MNTDTTSLTHHNLGGFSLPKRQEEIKHLLASSNTAPTFPVKFRGQTENLVIHRVALGFLKYRLTNGRTMTDQVQYIEENGESPDYFGPSNNEVDEVQDAQHRLLVERARTKSDDDLFTHFESNKKKQEDPLIIDQLGFVVNGNRRLATFRELFIKDQTEFAHFEHVSVVILPSTATEDDVLSVEAELQLIKDVKSDYDWADRAFMLRTYRNRTSDKEVMRIFGLSAKEVLNQITELGLAEEFLKASDQANLYRKVANMEEAFRSLRKAFEDKTILDSEPKRELYKRIVFGMLGGSQRDGRIYSTIPDAKEALPEIIDQLQKGQIIDPGLLNDAIAQIKKVSKEDPLETLFTFDDEEPDALQDLTIQAVINLLADTENSPLGKELTKAAFDIIEDQREQKKIDKSEAGAAKLIEKANTFLTNALTALDSQSKLKKASILLHLSNIETSITTIREWAAED